MNGRHRAVLVLGILLGTLAAAGPATAEEPPLERLPRDGDPKCPDKLPPEVCDLLVPIFALLGVPYVDLAYVGTCCPIDCVYDRQLGRSVVVEHDEYAFEVGIEKKGVRTPIVWGNVFVPVTRVYPGNVC